MGTEFTNSQVQKTIGNNLKRLRKAQNISQLDLGLIAGLAHNTINDIENGKKGISIDSLVKLTNALDTEPHQFFLPPFKAGTNMQLYAQDLNKALIKATADFFAKYLPLDSDPEK